MSDGVDDLDPDFGRDPQRLEAWVIAAPYLLEAQREQIRVDFRKRWEITANHRFAEVFDNLPKHSWFGMTFGYPAAWYADVRRHAEFWTAVRYFEEQFADLDEVDRAKADSSLMVPRHGRRMR